MKFLLILAMAILTTLSSYAFGQSKYDPRDLLGCPMSSEHLLEVAEFLPSANSNSNRGICYVKANSYSWWDLMETSDRAYEIEVNAGFCNSQDFIRNKDKLLIKATVSYKGKVSRCESNPGCHYTCKPIIKLWSLAP
ncbi:MAG: hypothetical protein IPM97_12380 [Bdellovibrionaceae bacterium]|nr:hypothetical protein [Pseudobdellovibrionaceae bacterium]